MRRCGVGTVAMLLSASSAEHVAQFPHLPHTLRFTVTVVPRRKGSRPMSSGSGWLRPNSSVGTLEHHGGPLGRGNRCSADETAECSAQFRLLCSTLPVYTSGNQGVHPLPTQDKLFPTQRSPHHDTLGDSASHESCTMCTATDPRTTVPMTMMLADDDVLGDVGGDRDDESERRIAEEGAGSAALGRGVGDWGERQSSCRVCRGKRTGASGERTQDHSVATRAAEVTFSGSYDFGYLMRMLTAEKLPQNFGGPCRAGGRGESLRMREARRRAPARGGGLLATPRGDSGAALRGLTRHLMGFRW